MKSKQYALYNYIMFLQKLAQYIRATSRENLSSRGICKNKGADQLRGNQAADQCLCFHYNDSIIPQLSKPEISISGQKPRRQFFLRCRPYVSRVVRIPAFCICENKDADQLRGNREADQRLCFRYTDTTIPLLSKSEISSF